MSRSPNHGLYRPPIEPGMTIGLYGGSFNPPHDGHRHVALTALHRLCLQKIWCLVTPGNPLKDNRSLPSLNRRLDQTAQIMNHPSIAISALEAKIGTNYSAQTIRWLTNRYPKTRFIWVMGADNLANFHHWKQWKSIFATLPIAIIDRPGYSLSPLSSRAAQTYQAWRLPEKEAKSLSANRGPCWTYLHGPKSDLSSTRLRSQKGAK
ncbi:MAG: nicotinate-nucleotide adenylyltransferase [Cohaesibacter sp.]|nr:nicotinate-nucleotide adenylyltransferase [Cohaesibacter sp.]